MDLLFSCVFPVLWSLLLIWRIQTQRFSPECFQFSFISVEFPASTFAFFMSKHTEWELPLKNWNGKCAAAADHRRCSRSPTDKWVKRLISMQTEEDQICSVSPAAPLTPSLISFWLKLQKSCDLISTAADLCSSQLAEEKKTKKK